MTRSGKINHVCIRIELPPVYSELQGQEEVEC